MIITFSGVRRGVNLSWVLRKDRAERKGGRERGREKCTVDKAVLPFFLPAPPPGRSFWRLWLSSCKLPTGKSWAVNLVQLCRCSGVYPLSEIQSLPEIGVCWPEGETFSVHLCQTLTSILMWLTGCVPLSWKNAPSDAFEAQFLKSKLKQHLKVTEMASGRMCACQDPSRSFSLGDGTVCLGLLPSGGRSPPTWTFVWGDQCQAGWAWTAQWQKLGKNGKEGEESVMEALAMCVRQQSLNTSPKNIAREDPNTLTELSFLPGVLYHWVHRNLC